MTKLDVVVNYGMAQCHVL